jgi:hypothetical protein
MQVPLREGDADTGVGEGLVDGPIQRRSLRSQLRIVVARMRILVTTPSVSPTVTLSPTRIVRSNRMIRPLTPGRSRAGPGAAAVASVSHGRLPKR